MRGLVGANNAKASKLTMSLMPIIIHPVTSTTEKSVVPVYITDFRQQRSRKLR